MEGHYRYWGKCRPVEPDGAVSFHPLIYHALDVTAVAACWLDNDAVLRHALCVRGSEAQRQRAWLLFFIALHDIGKLDIRFQAKALNVWLALNPESKSSRFPTQAQTRLAHGPAGLYWCCYDAVVSDVDEHPRQHWLPWLEAVCGHHGYVVRVADLRENDLALPYELYSHAARDRSV